MEASLSKGSTPTQRQTQSPQDHLKPFLEIEEMAQQLKARLLSQRTSFDLQHPHGSSKPSVILVPGDS